MTDQARLIDLERTPTIIQLKNADKSVKTNITDIAYLACYRILDQKEYYEYNAIVESEENVSTTYVITEQEYNNLRDMLNYYAIEADISIKYIKKVDTNKQYSSCFFTKYCWHEQSSISIDPVEQNPKGNYYD